MLDQREIERRHTAQWCAGLPLVGERSLRPDERAKLAHLGWGLLWKSVAALLLTAIGVIPSFLKSLRHFETSDTAVFAVVGLTLVLALVFMSLVIAREGWLQRSLLLFSDLGRGSVKTFSGELARTDLLRTADGVDPTQHSLLRQGLLTLGGREVQSIEVLPISCRVMTLPQKTGGLCQYSPRMGEIRYNRERIEACLVPRITSDLRTQIHESDRQSDVT